MGKKQNELDASDMMGSLERINTGLLNNHVFFLTSDIDEFVVEDIIKWIIYENTINEEGKVLTLYINSMGGELQSSLALIDVMRASRYPIKTVGIGSIMSAAFLIFACGTKGNRIISRNTSIMFHQYSGGYNGKYHDMESYSKEMGLTSNRITDLLLDVSELDYDTIKTHLIPPSDVWMTPEDLIEYGIADMIYG